MINIKNRNKADVLASLYNKSQPLGMGMLHFTPEDMTTSEAQEYLDDRGKGPENPPRIYFDYLKGRVMKVNLTSDEEFDGGLYDRDNGQGAAQQAVNDVPEITT